MKRTAAFFVLLLSALPCAWAGNISIQTQVRPELDGNVLRVAIDAANRGDESAYTVQIEAEIAGVSKQSPVEPTLSIGKSHSASFRFPLKNMLPGRYPIIIRIHYADANLYPFSALTVASFVWKTEASTGVFGTLGETRLHKHARLKLKLRNMEEETRPLHVRLLAPQEISFEPDSMDLSLPPKKESTFAFSLSNFSALGGSTYPVFGLIEYDKAGMHHSALAMGIVRIVDSSFAYQEYWLPLFALLLVLFLFVNVQAFWKKK